MTGQCHWPLGDHSVKLELSDGNRTIVSALPKLRLTIRRTKLKLEPSKGIEPFFVVYETTVLPLYEQGINSGAATVNRTQACALQVRHHDH